MSQIHRNQTVASRGRYSFQRLLSLENAEKARAEIARCPLYEPTPLRPLRDIATSAGVDAVWYKDEATRFGLGSFKALGGAYAVGKILQARVERETAAPVTLDDLARGCYREHTSKITVTCATDGNHGRSVSAGAKAFGCSCTIFLHERVSEGREREIAAFGASIVRVTGNYDDSVRACRTHAENIGWEIISDTSWPGYVDTPCIVMQGYTVMILEVLEQLRANGHAMPTHVFLQGGVGGLAAAAVATFWEALGPEAPVFIVVEPERADCLYQSALAGRRTPASGDLNTIMAGLSCGEVSEVAWRILSPAVNYFMTISDQAAIDVMRQLAARETPIVAGESAVPGLAAFLMLVLSGTYASMRGEIGLTKDARVLVIGTEGATDPDLYRQLVSVSHARGRGSGS